MKAPAGRRLALLAVCTGLVAAMAACSGDDSGSDGKPSAGGSGSSGSSSSAAVTPGGDATAFPVPATASAQPLPSLGTREGLGYTVTLNGVRRVSDSSVLVTATLVPKQSGTGNAFDEPGYTTWKNPDTGKLESNYDFSAVSLTVKGDPKIYQVMRDDQQFCACTRGMITVSGGVPIGVYAYVTAPADASTVTVTVRGLDPFTDVKVGA